MFILYVYTLNSEWSFITNSSMGRLKMQDIKMAEQVAGHENDGPSKLQVVRMQDMKMQDLKMLDTKIDGMKQFAYLALKLSVPARNVLIWCSTLCWFCTLGPHVFLLYIVCVCLVIIKITVIVILNKEILNHKRRAHQNSCTVQSVQYSISCIHDIKNKCKKARQSSSYKAKSWTFYHLYTYNIAILGLHEIYTYISCPSFSCLATRSVIFTSCIFSAHQFIQNKRETKLGTIPPSPAWLPRRENLILRTQLIACHKWTNATM